MEHLCAMVGDRFELTPRERDVLFLLAQNYRAPYIAEKLVVSQSTVKTHMRNLYGKLDVHSQAELLLLIDREAEGLSAREEDPASLR
ncbi:MAG: helix-turn-helix transcriptional regulator [Enterorhabdus sp.]|nr:helix-turn-helix transcriptional regulator [Enterorhabdus sp.]